MSTTISSSYPVSSGSAETGLATYGVGTASSKLADRKADSPTGAQRPGDKPGYRRLLEIGDLPLGPGEVLLNTVLAFEIWGELSPQRNNAVLTLHAPTDDPHVTGRAEPGYPTPGRWSDLVGPGWATGAERYFMVTANVLGGCQGLTGPSSAAPNGRPWGLRSPWLTTRDAVETEACLADALGIEVFHLVIGASLGGHRTIEWGVTHPQWVRDLALTTTSALMTAGQLAWCHLQGPAIVADPFFSDSNYCSHSVGPMRGPGPARALARTTYRSAAELDGYFGWYHQGEEDSAVDGCYQMESYLDYHAGKLLARFDVNTYLIVTHSMVVHDVGTGRDGIEATLTRVQARALVVGVDSDRFFLPIQAEELTGGIPGARREIINSLYRHDGFLTEVEQVDTILCDFLAGV